MTGLVIEGTFGPLMVGQKNPNLWVPKVSVSLVRSDDETHSSFTLLAPKLTALIDTGAQDSCVDRDLAEKHGLRKSREGIMLGFEDQTTLQGYDFMIALDGTSKAYYLEGPSRHFRREGADFDVVLGWSFLQFYGLHVSRKSGTVKLAWGE